VNEAWLTRIPARVVSLAATPFDVGSWFAASVPAGALINGLGLGALAFLFARDIILTKGQHLRRVADIQTAHIATIAEKDQRIADLKSAADNRITDLNAAHASRVADLLAQMDRMRLQYEGTVTRLLAEQDYERKAKDIERARADEMIQHIREMAQEYGATAVHLLKAIDQISPDRAQVST
jgi:hypothetical protein